LVALALCSGGLAHGEGPDPSGSSKNPSLATLVDQPAPVLVSMGERGLRSDPGLAFAAWRALRVQAETAPDLLCEAETGLGRSWLMIGQAQIALRYARSVLGRRPSDTGALALHVRALIRAGTFTDALRVAEAAKVRVGLGNADMRAAHAAALYRNRRLVEAEESYRVVLQQQPRNIEALVRLGTGLLPVASAPASDELQHAACLQRKGHFGKAQTRMIAHLDAHPSHSTALRMLGELLLTIDRSRVPLVRDAFYDRLWTDLLRNRLGSERRLPRGMRKFFPAFGQLDRARQRMVVWSALPFAGWLRRVAKNGGRHDLMHECERTTDASERAWLRGRRTFDGRVWDDVRGIGGLCAATGVEALDDAHTGGFQTLVHELAHQVHLYALPRVKRDRITVLYRRAKRDGLCLDYYAASNEAEYFAQGVEAFFSYVKVAGQPVTHGHTHFELRRRDPELFALIGELAEVDPLASGGASLTARLFEAALQTARVADARALLRRLPAEQRTKARKRALGRATNQFRAL
jgi:hypothetical protein